MLWQVWKVMAAVYVVRWLDRERKAQRTTFRAQPEVDDFYHWLVVNDMTFLNIHWECYD